MVELLIYQSNWADEMDVVGWSLFEDHEATEMMAALEAKDAAWWAESSGWNTTGRTYNIGTNEEIGYKSFEELQRDIFIQEITVDDANTLTALFGVSAFGHYDVLEALLEEEDEVWDEDKFPAHDLLTDDQVRDSDPHDT